MKKQPFKVGDRVNVSRDGTVYVIETLGPRAFDCTIREEGTVDGKPYAAQRFDTSLLDFEDPYRNMRVKRIKGGK